MRAKNAWLEINLRELARKRESWTKANSDVYAWPFKIASILFTRETEGAYARTCKSYTTVDNHPKGWFALSDAFLATHDNGSKFKSRKKIEAR